MLLISYFQKGETSKTIPENKFKMLVPRGTSKWCRCTPRPLTFFLYDGPLSLPPQPCSTHARAYVMFVQARYDAILNQSEHINLYNHWSNYTEYE